MSEGAPRSSSTRANAPVVRRPNARGAARREALIDAAVRLFSERGFRGTGIIGLAKEVGMTHAGLLHHFGTKEGLLHAVVATRDEHFAEVLRTAGNGRGLDTTDAVLVAGQQFVADPQLSRLFTVLIGENLMAENPLNGLFRERYRTLRKCVASALRAGQVDGTVDPDADAEGVAAEVVAFLLGLQSEHLLDPDAVDVVAVCAGYARRLRASLAVPATPA
ncbi:MAG TPA: TetR/AcrR family transcriptional regulator [Acidimicrobiales bacterium]|nr:TetR/AcrR family transcriptional regulator [Acidimicrobiales bacterium]